MDIELVIVIGVVAAAALYLGQRAFRTMRAQLKDEEAACGGCGGDCGPEPEGRKGRLPVIGPAVLAGLLVAGPALAADTVETFDVGATDLEFYVGLDGVGPKQQDRTLSTEFVVGFGIVDGLSLYTTGALEANHRFVDGSAGLGVGLFGTPLDTDHFDIDLVLDVSAGGDHFTELAVAPMAEFNLDLDPEMGSWGLYVRAGAEIAGQPTEQGDEAAGPAVAVLLNPGTYLTIAGRHQVLLEYDMAIAPRTADQEAGVDVGGLALGYNVTLADPFELVTQVAVDIPQEGEQAEVGFAVGFVATLPSPAQARAERVASADERPAGGAPR